MYGFIFQLLEPPVVSWTRSMSSDGDSTSMRVEFETEGAGVASAISIVELTPYVRANITVVSMRFISNLVYRQINFVIITKTNRIAL